MRALKVLGVTLWKEWRDHKVMLIAIAIALPFLTAVAFWAFGEHLVGSPVRVQLLIFLPVALGLVFFSIAADLVSGEKRRNTLDLLRRLPGGMARTFAIKWVFLLVVSLGAMLYQGVLLAWTWEWMAEYGGNGGQGGFDISNEIYTQMGAFPSSWFWQLALVGMVLPPWAFVVSTWLGRSGAAAIGSLLVLGGLLAPWVLMIMQYPWFFPFGPEHLPMIAGVVIGMALLVSAVSYVGGLRYHGAVWKPGLYGLAAVLILAGAGYGYAHVELHRWLSFDEHDPDMRIKDAYLAEGGTRLYVNVHKGHPWLGGEPDPSRGDGGPWIKRGMPVQTWVVDLQTGAVTVDSRDGKHLFLPMSHGSGARWTAASLAPHTIMQRWYFDAEESYAIRWIDAATGDVIDTLAPQTRSPAVDRAIRADARRYGAHVDSKGRRVWIRDGETERDGALVPIGDRVRVITGVQGAWSMWCPDGWTRYRFEPDEPGSRNRSLRWYFVDAETGEEIDVTRKGRGGGQSPGAVLDREWTLRNHANARVVERLVDGVDRREVEDAPLQLLGVVAPRRVLGTYPTEDDRRELRLWDPVTGDTWPIELQGGPLPKDVNVTLRGRTEDGRVLLTSLVGGAEWRYLLLVVDPKALRATVLASGDGWPGTAIVPMTLEDDGSVIAIEAERRIVRFGPEADAREVLFPR